MDDNERQPSTDMDDEDERRLARNEALFRHVNESIERGQWPGDEDAPVAYRCECSRLGCNELITLTPRAYGEIRSSSRRFVILPGHGRPEFETVVETRPGYDVVEKRDEAGRVADGTDPRG